MFLYVKSKMAFKTYYKSLSKLVERLKLRLRCNFERFLLGHENVTLIFFENCCATNLAHKTDVLVDPWKYTSFSASLYMASAMVMFTESNMFMRNITIDQAIIINIEPKYDSFYLVWGFVTGKVSTMWPECPRVLTIIICELGLGYMVWTVTV